MTVLRVIPSNTCAPAVISFSSFTAKKLSTVHSYNSPLYVYNAVSAPSCLALFRALMAYIQFNVFASGMSLLASNVITLTPSTKYSLGKYCNGFTMIIRLGLSAGVKASGPTPPVTTILTLFSPSGFSCIVLQVSSFRSSRLHGRSSSIIFAEFCSLLKWSSSLNGTRLQVIVKSNTPQPLRRPMSPTGIAAWL